MSKLVQRLSSGGLLTGLVELARKAGADSAGVGPFDRDREDRMKEMFEELLNRLKNENEETAKAHN